jgi:hypothetical protein
MRGYLRSKVGNAPITEQDYHKNITITFDHKVRLAVLDKVSDDMHSGYKVDKSNVMILDALLLNPTEQRRISVITMDGSNDINVKARIIGGKDYIARGI